MLVILRKYWSWTDLIQLYKGVLRAAETLSLFGSGKATSDPVPIQIFHR